MAKIICPKCGFEQDSGVECRRCGIIFERYRPSAEAQPSEPVAGPELEAPSPGIFRRVYRIFRWVALAGTVLAILLILRPSPPPRIAADPSAAQRAESKVRQHQLEAQAGRPHTLLLDQAEVNAWMSSNLALAPGDKAERERMDSEPTAPEPTATKKDPTLQEVQSTVRDVKVELLDDRIRAYVLFDFYGKDLSLLLEGRLLVREGYLRLQPTSVKLGSLPLLQATIEAAVGRLFDSPENREKFRLPPEIHDIRVEKGELKVSYR